MRVSLCHATNSTTKQNQPEVTFTHSLVNDKYNTVYTYSGKNQKDLGQFFGPPLSREKREGQDEISKVFKKGQSFRVLQGLWSHLPLQDDGLLGGGAGILAVGLCLEPGRTGRGGGDVPARRAEHAAVVHTVALGPRPVPQLNQNIRQKSEYIENRQNNIVILMLKPTTPCWAGRGR